RRGRRRGHDAQGEESEGKRQDELAHDITSSILGQTDQPYGGLSLPLPANRNGATTRGRRTWFSVLPAIIWPNPQGPTAAISIPTRRPGPNRNQLMQLARG